MHDDQSLPVAQRLREAICHAKTDADLDAAGASLRFAGEHGAITAVEYRDLKVLGSRTRAALRRAAEERARPGEAARVVIEAISKASTADNAGRLLAAAARRPGLFTEGEEQAIHAAYVQRVAEVG
jgi:hypothetical protein